MTSDNTLRQELESAYKEVTESTAAPVEESLEEVVENEADKAEPEAKEAPEREEKKEKASASRDNKGKFVKKDDVVEAPVMEQAPIEIVAAPQAWRADLKEKWATLPPDVQAEIVRRENDFHKMVTSRDGELRLGKELKDVINPYMPLINAEGGNPAAAVQSLLNTAYLLRTGTPEQKVGLLGEIARTYGIDIGALTQQVEQAPEMAYVSQLQSEIQQLKSQLNPERILNTLQERQEVDRIQAEISAFAAKPANKHFESVKAAMAPFLASGQAKDLQEAYDMACWADPSIRSTLLAEQKAAEDAKRKAEMEAKKKAAVSVKGSPSSLSGNATPKSQDRTLREELMANYTALTSGSKI